MVTPQRPTDAMLRGWEGAGVRQGQASVWWVEWFTGHASRELHHFAAACDDVQLDVLYGLGSSLETRCCV